MEIIRIAAQPKSKKVRIAVYCRVSTKQAEQGDSLEMQREAYISLIRTFSDRELVGVYADSLSGLSAEKRPEFMRMVSDAMAGKIDRILCKSVSRFSRNVAECKKYTDMLRSKNVTVEFEKEHLRTDDPTGSFVFSLMSAIAENESRSISENIRWGYRERYKRGEYNLGNNRILGYDTVDRRLTPNKDAWIVRTIFRQYADGVSLNRIRKDLADKGVLTKKGTPLSIGGIQYMLRNEAYCGDRLLGKTPPRDFITKRPLPDEQYEQHYLKNDHAAIVDAELWNAVQSKIKRELELKAEVGASVGRSHFLYGKLFCGECGDPMIRNSMTSTQGKKHKVWVCRDRHKGKYGNGCKGPNIKEEALLEELERTLGEPVTWENVDRIKRITVMQDGPEIEFV